MNLPAIFREVLSRNEAVQAALAELEEKPSVARIRALNTAVRGLACMAQKLECKAANSMERSKAEC